MLLVTAAASTLGVAAIAAGASLLGGILGAVAGGLSDHTVHKRQQRALARAGARLLRADLWACARTLRSIEHERRLYRHHTLYTEAWDKYRNELAMYLPAEDWAVVVDAVTNLRTWATGLTKLEEPPIAGLEADAAALKAIASVLEQVRLAYNALGPLAEGEEIPADEFGHRPSEQEALIGGQLVSR